MKIFLQIGTELIRVLNSAKCNKPMHIYIKIKKGTLTNSIPVGYLPWVRVWVDPQVHSQQPMAVPIPLGWVQVINEYRSG